MSHNDHGPLFASEAEFSETNVQHLLEQTTEQLQNWLDQRGLPPYRAAQIRRWLFEKRAGDFDDMSDSQSTELLQRKDKFKLIDSWRTRPTRVTNSQPHDTASRATQPSSRH